MTVPDFYSTSVNAHLFGYWFLRMLFLPLTRTCPVCAIPAKPADLFVAAWPTHFERVSEIRVDR